MSLSGLLAPSCPRRSELTSSVITEGDSLLRAPTEESESQQSGLSPSSGSSFLFAALLCTSLWAPSQKIVVEVAAVRFFSSEPVSKLLSG